MIVEYIDIRPPSEEEELIESIEQEQSEHQRILDEIAVTEREREQWEQEEMSLEDDSDLGKNFDIPKEAEDDDYVEYIEEDEMDD